MSRKSFLKDSKIVNVQKYFVQSELNLKNILLSQMTSDDLLMKLNQLQYTVPLTRKVRIEQSAVYSVPIISNWGSSVERVGGINEPLKLSLLSSDGIWSHELLKGNDDLRQDAVLEQVCTIFKFCSNNADLIKTESFLFFRFLM